MSFVNRIHFYNLVFLINYVNARSLQIDGRMMQVHFPSKTR